LALIEPLANEFTREEVLTLMQRAEENGQVSYRKRARRDHGQFMELISFRLDEDIDKEAYPSFFSPSFS
jgi:hypothetical protein